MSHERRTQLVDCCHLVTDCSQKFRCFSMVYCIRTVRSILLVFDFFRLFSSRNSIYVERSICYRASVCPPVCHTAGSVNKMPRYRRDHRAMRLIYEFPENNVSAKSADDCARISTLQSYHYSAVKSFSKYSIECDHGI